MPKKVLRSLQVGFGISIVILMASSTASYVAIKEQIKNRSDVQETREVIASAYNLLIDLQNVETGLRGFYLTGRESFLEPYEYSLQQMPNSLERLSSQTEDRPSQALRVDSLSRIIPAQTQINQAHIQLKRGGGQVTLGQLEDGKRFMDLCRRIINDLIQEEEVLLARGVVVLDRSTSFTTSFIILAAILSLIITSVFYMLIRKDVKGREKLQNQLRLKDAEIAKRLAILQEITYKVSHGDYSVRVEEDQEDDLGSIFTSINEMTASLERSFDQLNANEWRQTGVATLNEALVGNKTEQNLASDTLHHLVNYMDCVNGAMYLLIDGKLILQSTYGLEGDIPHVVEAGKGVIGQVFADKKERIFSDLEDEKFSLSFSSGRFRVSHILVFPILVYGAPVGVIELGSISAFEKDVVTFLKDVSRSLGLSLLAAKSRTQEQKLLEETQAQSEELQMQHAELENLNTELEAQAQKLQASEEELKVQQEELLQSNNELEERSKLLEEKNSLIATRNLEIKQKAEELALSSRYKSEFMANMSHELRTPLNSILLLSRLMAENTEENLNEEQIESAKVIQSSGTSLLSLIDEILDLSKIESGKMELDFQTVELAEITRDIQNLFGPMMSEKSLRFSIEMDPELDKHIRTDRQRLDQVLRNFLSNALKFTAEGDIALHIRNGKDSDTLDFAVSDTGIGIPEDKQKVVFEAFQQADGSTRRKYGGTGLGLAISKEIARLLGGDITLQSQENVGSTFTLTIPKQSHEPFSIKTTIEEMREMVAETVQEVDLQSEMFSASPILPLPEIPAEIDDDRHDIEEGDKMILIVEDDTNFAKALLSYTRKQGYKGIVVVRGDVAAEFAERYKPLAILLDIQLPVKNGWEVMEEIKANPKTRHIPVHIMSSLEVKKESLRKGAIDFINKPVALEQIGDIFRTIDHALTVFPKKVLIVEENPKHATALSYFLNNFNITTDIKNNVAESVEALRSKGANCVILDMGVPDQAGYETLEAIKNNQGLEDLPIIIFTGKNLSKSEEAKIKRYADSIVVKTAHSYQRILDEVGLFLHLIEEKDGSVKKTVRNTGSLSEVLQGKKVLIADDDVRNIFSLTKALEKFQMKVVSAVDGKDALATLAENPDIDIVLMDMMMPEMDGYETIREIRKQQQFQRLPIMAVTAKAMTGDREKCIVAGASDYISKPVDIDQLLSLLRVWLYES